MKLIFKLFVSLASLPFLIPWYLADKTFEYLVQPGIFKRHNLDVPKSKLLALKIAKYLPIALLLLYLSKRSFDFFMQSPDMATGVQNLKILFMLIYNDFAKVVNFFLLPINRMVFYLKGGQLEFWDFLISTYRCLNPLIFLTNLIYQIVKTKRSINQAVRLRNKAVQDVDIIKFSELAKDDEIFLGLDVNKSSDPFFAKRSWLKGHMQIIGGPGSGKTESIIQPIWYQEVRRNVATFVLDGKGSRRNVDKIYTIASSLAQGHEIYYFNPADPTRSDTYNPLLQGGPGDIKQKIMASINWSEHSTQTRENLDGALDVFLRAIEETHPFCSLREIAKYFHTPEFLVRQSEKIRDPYVSNRLKNIARNFSAFQSEMSFFISLLRDLFRSGYAKLLVTDAPTIDICDIYYGRKDCYFTLPMHTNEQTARFVGQLIIQDMIYCFNQMSMNTPEDGDADEGLMIIDEIAKFVNPDFIKLLKSAGNVGVSVLYTGQSMAELDDTKLGLSKVFAEQLADHTNAICCFQLGSPESIQAMINRFGNTKSNGNGKEEESNELGITDPDFIKYLEIGRCVMFFRRPRYLSVLKTGYFKFEKLFRFSGQRESTEENDFSFVDA